ncbi:MAG: hypothetical protein ABID54_13340, partial [Pseudomonadota bacterium]
MNVESSFVKDNKPGGFGYIDVRVPDYKVTFVALGDCHIGSPYFNEPLLKETIRYIGKENCFWIGMGDYLECATKSSPGVAVYEQLESPADQRKHFKSLILPIKGKCIGLVRGNHSWRVVKQCGEDPIDAICDDLGLPYFEWEVFGGVRREAGSPSAFTFYAYHSAQANKNAGLAEAAVERDVENWASVDIILRGHTHDSLVHPVKWVLPDSRNMRARERERWIWLTGHYLNRPHSYVSMKG